MNGTCHCTNDSNCLTGQVCCGGTCVSGQCGTPQLVIDAPAPKTTWPITAAPAMPTINAQAHIDGVTPDPTSTTAFTWTVQIRYKVQNCAHSPQVENPPDIVQTVVGGQFTPTFPTIRGGDLTLIVSATVNGQTLTKSRSGLTISGTNPQTTDIRALLPDDTLAKIACLESHMQQFVAGLDGRQGYCPNWSGDNLGGVGIMQLTRPAPTYDQVWNWKANVAGGITLYKQKVAEAQGYPSRALKTKNGKALVAAYNANRQKHGLKPLQSITLPPFDSIQLEHETIRLYNGGHEYRPAVDANGLLIVTVASGGTTGTAQWTEIPVAAQPHCHTCCPNYVNMVLSENPTCSPFVPGTCCPDRPCP